jgi:iron(III) transport system ATP-binding protein
VKKLYAIELQSVSKTYVGASTKAVDDFSLNVEKGSIITLLGPSGCGKTTLLRLIAGFEKPDTGSIFISGNPVSHQTTWIAPEKRGIGMVFQDYALFPHLTVFDNIGFGYTQKDRKTRVLEILELVNLNQLENRYIHELSGGQQQRVALARALAKRPSVILLDEPFSNLDADLKMMMRSEMKRIIKDSNSTAIFVSHDQKDALAVSDKIIVMKDGVIQQIGPSKEIYRHPKNRFVASFVGRSNILEGTLSDDGKSVHTSIGIVQCNQSNSLCCGKKVCLSIRPDSLEISNNSDLKGKIKQYSYTGERIDAIVTVTAADGSSQDLLLHTPPEKEINIGDTVCFNVIPNFVSVVKDF